MPIKIVVADDHHINRNAFVLMLEMQKNYEVCAQVGNGSETLHSVKMHRPHILFLDLQMPVINGFEVLEKLQQQNEQVKTIVFSAFNSEKNIVRCMELGACGFLSKDAPPGREVEAVESVIANGFYFEDKTSLSLLNHTIRLKKFIPHFNDDTIHFDETEMKVVHLHCCQYNNPEIADKMPSSFRTVEGIKRRMVNRLGVINFAGVVLYCHQQRLIDLDSIPLRKASKAA